MARPRVADEEDGLQIWKVVANILNKQSRAADKGWSSSLGVGRGVIAVKISLLRIVTQGIRIGRILWNDVGNRNWMEDNIRMDLREV